MIRTEKRVRLFKSSSVSGRPASADVRYVAQNRSANENKAVDSDSSSPRLYKNNGKRSSRTSTIFSFCSSLPGTGCKNVAVGRSGSRHTLTRAYSVMRGSAPPDAPPKSAPWTKMRGMMIDPRFRLLSHPSRLSSTKDGGVLCPRRGTRRTTGCGKMDGSSTPLVRSCCFATRA